MTSYLYAPSGPYTCNACSMGFSSNGLLAKHKARFCIGSGHDMVLVRNCKRCESRCHCDDNDFPERSKYNPNNDPKLQSLAENHGKQMEFLSNRNRDLERQRDEIRRRLGDLGRKPPESDNTAALIAELRDQEARNQRLLEELKKQLLASRQPVAIIGEQQHVQQKKSFTYPIYYGNSLVAEISAIRQAYIQSGGDDPEILAQLAQMLAEAQAIEEAMRNKKPPEPKQKEKKTDFSAHIMTLDMENERLNRELYLLQEQNLMAKGRRKDDREDELEREIRRLQQDHLLKMYELQQNMEAIRQETKIQLELNSQQQNPPQNIIVHQPPCPQPIAAAPIQPAIQTKYIEVDRHTHCYDQHAGFVIFYDFVLNLDPRVTAVRLIAGLHNTISKMGDPSVLPMVYAEPSTRPQAYNTNSALIGARQPVPRCPPQPDLGIVVELQCAGGPGSEHDETRLITRAWTKIPLFDDNNMLLAGRFKLPLRMVPIKPFVSSNDLSQIPQYGESEIYYRIVHMNEAGIHATSTIADTNSVTYQLAPQGGIVLHQTTISPVMIPPPPSTSPPHSPYHSRLDNYPVRGNPNMEPLVGFQVDRVKNAEPGEGKVRLSVYYSSTGKVAQSGIGPVTCSTTAVRSNFKQGYHVFGQQEASFSDVQLQGDMMLIARFYLKKKTPGPEDVHFDNPEASPYEDETLVAWTALPLVQTHLRDLTARSRMEYDPSHMRINTGTHTLKLFQPPTPEASRIPFEDVAYNREWKPYGKSTLRIHIFQGVARPGSLTPSELSSDGEDTIPEFAWLPLDRKRPPSEPYISGDGFDVYIDGCRFLPDSVTFTKVAGRVLDRKYEVYGKDILTSVKLDSDIYNPIYEHKEEFREPNIPPSSTLLLKIYTVDSFYKKLTVVGYATMNIFVETGTERQPNVDKNAMEISLNTGAHQLRLYSQGPNGVDPLSEGSLRNANIRLIPCASVLVRIVKVPKGPNGKPLESNKVPQSDWLRLGLWQPRPKYSDRVYYSMKCVPLKGENKMLHGMMKRPKIPTRDAVATHAQAKEGFMRSDKNMEQYIKNQLTKTVDSKPLEQDLNFICQYNPKHGFKISIDSAVNVPWSNFTHGHICINPPGAFYLGAPHATYDKLVFTEAVDLRSTNTSPAWRDGFKHYPRRSYHRFLTAVIHLQEIFVSASKENYKYGLLEQAWTVVQIFKENYAYTSAFQLPLFQGSPNQQFLKQLAREPSKEWMERNIRSKNIKLLEGASLYMRICDGRREDELVTDVPMNRLVGVNTDYIPRGLEEKYGREKPGRALGSLVPQGKSSEQFVENLAIKFKSLVYKLYEEGNVSKS
ncbi:uncharacterized protein LOC126818261 isoform X2 [Patella vulgata]|uniref:uncharacterized protein LOC126818261 isoform X2 n=1 Tax=Patella vulgata TaxID=6465 RepID=UPI002180704F|nr:uncharacterized protein LOC126818261 isoform X2 [Patella vulgata]XP_050401530.1 uncharacterized protein LOC126818261 isoform X2 [Patella vulgata]